MKPILLPPRLALAASFVRKGSRLADIGTDHAHLPVWLLQQGVIPSAVAADVMPGPLERAKETASRYGLTDVISCRLSDGFSAVRSDEFDDGVICGMGGLTLLEILKAAHPFSPHQRLILQPQKDFHLVRGWLAGQGYELVEERAVREKHRVYSVMCCRYTGIITPGGPEIYLGKLKPFERPDDRFFLQKQLRLWQERLKGAMLGGKEDEIRKDEKAVRMLVQGLEAGPPHCDEVI